VDRPFVSDQSLDTGRLRLGTSSPAKPQAAVQFCHNPIAVKINISHFSKVGGRHAFRE
jgi:hypothetical protein